ncbi:MAG: endonuclease [Elusimicrobia bacterium HGW-Elusimicrobia-4]|nr:MAG: endonuclease [Elusimicrobia bacterium HGW-Elusimicrobia-4]
MPYYVYILKCSDNTLYTGITPDLKRRIDEHNKGNGARYTSNKTPVKCVYSEKQPDRSSALKRECEIKSWTREHKLTLTTSKKCQLKVRK